MSSSLSARLSNIACYQDATVYGAFPEFVPCLAEPIVTPVLERLGAVTRSVMQPIVDELPDAWEVPPGVRSAIVSFLVDRAAYLQRNLIANIALHIKKLTERPA